MTLEKITEKLNRMINVESAATMTAEQEHYVAGLSDALRVVEDYADEQLVIGHKYYVIMKNKVQIPKYIVKEMQLYRINYNKQKVSYCFTDDFDNPTPSLVLYSEIGLKKRVFRKYDDAITGIQYVDLR